MQLTNYLEYIHLPNPTIKPQGEISRAFLAKNILTLWDAIDFVNKLPYGRNTNRENYQQVLSEKCGACSTKHALIAALAVEMKIPLKLILGIFLLTPENTPKITPILLQYQLEAIPEAHCILKYQAHTLDITFPNTEDFTFQAQLEQEIEITPTQIGSFKVEKHQMFIKKWLKDKPCLQFDTIWAAREQWIRELSKK